jgi:hypothetical protein
MRISFLLLSMLIITSSCSKKVKENIGIASPGPDEYKVQRGKPLEIPPHYYLNPPTQSEQHKHSGDNTTTTLDQGEKSLLDEIEAKKN